MIKKKTQAINNEQKQTYRQWKYFMCSTKGSDRVELNRIERLSCYCTTFVFNYKHFRQISEIACSELRYVAIPDSCIGYYFAFPHIGLKSDNLGIEFTSRLLLQKCKRLCASCL